MHKPLQIVYVLHLIPQCFITQTMQECYSLGFFLKRPIVCENIFDYLNVSCGGSGTTTVYMELKFIAPSCIVGTLFNCGALNM